MLPTPVEQRVAKHKQRYNEILHTTGPGLEDQEELHIICRPLSMQEAMYHGEVAARDEQYAIEFVVKMATLDVYATGQNSFIQLGEMPIGIFQDIYNIVIENSGFGNPDALIQSLGFYRSVSGHTHVQATAFICKAFSGYTPRDIENMSVDVLAKNIVLAEIIHDTEFKLITEEETNKAKEQEESQVMNKIRRETSMNDRIHRTMGQNRQKRFVDLADDNANLKEAMK